MADEEEEMASMGSMGGGGGVNEAPQQDSKKGGLFSGFGFGSKSKGKA